jgi:putative ABC transport system substrate-binding protein
MPIIGCVSLRVGMWIAALMLLIAAPPGMAGDAQAIVVLVSQDAEPYRQALAGVEKALRQRKPNITVTAKHLAGDQNKAAEAVQEAMRQRALAVVTLGGVATQAAIRMPSRGPVVAGLVPTAASLKGGSGAITGVVLEFSAETQFRWLRRFLPNSRTVGVLYNPAENKETVAAAASAAGRQGFTLDAVEVEDPRQLPTALEAIGKRVDVLLGLPDRLILTADTAKQILLLSFRNRVPFVGPSPSWAKAGALYALAWDYEDLGMQCGEMVDRIIQDGATASVAPVGPRKVLYAVNQRTAQHMRLELPEALLRGASELF